MSWPGSTIVTTNLDSGTDSPAAARVDLLDAVTKTNQIIGARGTASGVASLDAGTLIPDAQIPADVLRASAAQTITGAKTFATPPVLNNDVYISCKNAVGESTRLIGASVNGDIYIGAMDTTATPINTIHIRTNGTDALVVTATTATIGGVPLVKNTDVIPVATGGTGATTTLAARANLGVTIRIWGSEASMPLNSTFLTAGPIAHGLGGYPDGVQMYLRCTVAEHGYAVGDQIYFESASNNAGGGDITYLAVTNATDTTIVRGPLATSMPSIPPKTGGARVFLTAANWWVYAQPYRYI